MTGIDPMKHPFSVKVSIAKSGCHAQIAFTFVHEIKPAVTIRKRSMTATKHPHWKHTGEKHRQLGVDLEVVVMNGCCFEPIMSVLMDK